MSTRRGALISKGRITSKLPYMGPGPGRARVLSGRAAGPARPVEINAPRHVEINR